MNPSPPTMTVPPQIFRGAKALRFTRNNAPLAAATVARFKRADRPSDRSCDIKGFDGDYDAGSFRKETV